MGKVGVQTHPAPITAAIEPGNGVPMMAPGIAINLQVMLGPKLNGGIPHGDGNALPGATARVMNFSSRQGGRANAGLRSRINPKTGWQDGFCAGQLQLGQGFRRQRCSAP